MNLCEIINEEIGDIINITKLALSLKKEDRPSLKNHILTDVDMNKADRAFSYDTGFYIGKDDKGMYNRREKVRNYIQRGVLQDAPIVHIKFGSSGELILSFTDGRHRFAELRDLGATRINLCFTPESKNYISLLK